jgi:ATP-binding cassette subfamily F protein 3
MLIFNEVTLQRGPKVLLEKITLTIFAKQKIGLIGRNGCGKTSLFALLLKKLEPDHGSLNIQPGLQIATLSQEVPHTALPAIQYVIEGDVELAKLNTQLLHAEQNDDFHAVAQIHSQLFEIGGYSAKARAGQLLHGLGFAADEYEKPVNEFSGGWRMRLNLAQALMCHSDLLLLDEPTNHLDLDAIVWLENWLSKYPGTLILISHDQDFLDNTVTTIFHIENKTINIYTGNFSGFEEQRASRLAQKAATYEKQQNQITHITSFVDRFRAKASKARQVQSRIKALEKIKRVAAVTFDEPFSFSFKQIKKLTPPILGLEKISFGYNPGKLILNNISFTINPGERIGLLGKNGLGKSTFLKLLAGNILPLSGDMIKNKSLKIGYFAQHQIEQLDLSASPLEQLLRISPSSSEQMLRNFLGQFNFRGEMVRQSITNFSGGEKARLVLAILVLQEPNLLLLDEPTNNLDLDMKKALLLALQDFQGALILVSHDRYLLRATVDELFLINDQKITLFEGDLEDYRDWLLTKPIEKQPVASSQKKSKPNPSRELRIEQKLKNLYQSKKELEARLADSDLYTNYALKSELDDCLWKLKQIKEEITSLENQWFDLSDN